VRDFSESDISTPSKRARTLKRLAAAAWPLPSAV
jgi:hypothetical protein